MAVRFAPILTPENIHKSPRKPTVVLSSKVRIRYGPGGRNITQNAAVHIDLGPGEAAGAFEQAARCVNEALEGGLLGDLDHIAEFNDEDMLDLEGEGYKEEDVSSGDDLGLSSSDDQSRLPSNSARGVAEQVIARTTYDIKRQVKAAPAIHAALDQFTHRDLENSQHRSAYEQHADVLEGLAARVRSRLLSAAHHTSSQTNTQPPTSTQHDTSTIPILPSPEKRQNRKESHSIH
ncbi:hypothetical protein RhiTH_011027 [Rhizoctonia solani]